MSDEDFMELALAQAREAALIGEVPVGAVIVRHGVVIACGRNAPVGRNDPTAHAEVAALRAAALALANYRLDECELFVTLEPCAMCSGAMLTARLKRVVFGAAEPKTGAAGSVVNLFANKQLNHHTHLQGGVLAEASGDLLKHFFRRRRIAQRDPSTRAFRLRDDALRTPDAAFAALNGFPWLPRYINELPSLDGLRMHYIDEQGCTEEGGTTPKTYLCLHDIPGWSYQYRKMIGELRYAGYRVIAPDLIGFGRSDKPKKESFHTFSRHRQILLELVENLDLQHIVLAVSPGSQLLGLTLPVAAPHRYDALHIIKTSFLAPQEIPLSSGFGSWQECCLSHGDVSSATVTAMADLSRKVSAEEKAAYLAPFQDSGHCAALRGASAISSNGSSFNDAGIADTVNRFWRDIGKH